MESKYPNAYSNTHDGITIYYSLDLGVIGYEDESEGNSVLAARRDFQGRVHEDYTKNANATIAYDELACDSLLVAWVAVDWASASLLARGTELHQ